MMTFNWGGVINTTACWQPVLTTLVDEKAHVSAPCHVVKWKTRVLKNVMFRHCAKKTEHSLFKNTRVAHSAPNKSMSHSVRVDCRTNQVCVPSAVKQCSHALLAVWISCA